MNFTTVLVIPIVKANIAIKIITMFFKTTIEKRILSPRWHQKTKISTTAGNAIPIVDKQNAPINDINNSKFGIAAAIKTINKLRKIYVCTTEI